MVGGLPVLRRVGTAAGSNRRIRKTVRPVVWEGAGAQSPVPDPIKEHTMEAVVVAGILRASDLILQSKNNAFSVSNAKWFHSFMRSHSIHYAQLLMRSVFIARSGRARRRSQAHSRQRPVRRQSPPGAVRPPRGPWVRRPSLRRQSHALAIVA